MLGSMSDKLKKFFAQSDNHKWFEKLEQKDRDRIDYKGPNECAIWKAKFAGSGQPMRFIGDGKSAIAYRYFWEIVYGEKPPKILRHICDEGKCVNPLHLMPGTVRTNNDDSSRRGLIKRLLSDREVQEIRWLAENGRKFKDIALEYGVSPEMCGQVMSRKRYAWLSWEPRKPKDE